MTDPQATTDRAARLMLLTEQIGDAFEAQRKFDVEQLQHVLDHAYHEHVDESKDRTVNGLTKHLAQAVYVWCQDRYE